MSVRSRVMHHDAALFAHTYICFITLHVYFSARADVQGKANVHNDAEG
jgi:Ni,Fe-hydrogenase I cytochrome b subunit